MSSERLDRNGLCWYRGDARGETPFGLARGATRGGVVRPRISCALERVWGRWFGEGVEGEMPAPGCAVVVMVRRESARVWVCESGNG